MIEIAPIGAPFRLRWTTDLWHTSQDTHATPTALGVEYADIPIAPGRKGPVIFAFFWTDAGRWEGRDFEVAIRGS